MRLDYWRVRLDYWRIIIRNLTHFHERLMAYFLRRRGWVVFYLEKPYRKCGSPSLCWLGLYEQREDKRLSIKSRVNKFLDNVANVLEE